MHAESVAQNSPSSLAPDNEHLLLATMALNELVNHAAVERSRPIKRIKRREVFNALRFQLPANLLHAQKIQTERPHPSALPRNTCHRFLVVKRYIGPVNLCAQAIA